MIGLVPNHVGHKEFPIVRVHALLTLVEELKVQRPLHLAYLLRLLHPWGQEVRDPQKEGEGIDGRRRAGAQEVVPERRDLSDGDGTRGLETGNALAEDDGGDDGVTEALDVVKEFLEIKDDE